MALPVGAKLHGAVFFFAVYLLFHESHNTSKFASSNTQQVVKPFVIVTVSVQGPCWSQVKSAASNVDRYLFIVGAVCSVQCSQSVIRDTCVTSAIRYG